MGRRREAWGGNRHACAGQVSSSGAVCSQAGACILYSFGKECFFFRFLPIERTFSDVESLENTAKCKGKCHLCPMSRTQWGAGWKQLTVLFLLPPMVERGLSVVALPGPGMQFWVHGLL